mmetsp:Transcript_31004/g.70937  ORF Transcript_31004/g.70937 Transcript_31004/m.70937 type:complete len:1235 (-) Transcript_31004:66-3770(-)
MVTKQFCPRLLFLFLISLVISINVVQSAPKREVNYGEILVQWLRSRGGYVNPKLEVRRVDPLNPTSRFGIFTKEDLKLKERLIAIPSSSLITDVVYDNVSGGDQHYGNGLNCRTVHNLLKEMRWGKASNFSPYLEFITADDDETIPSGWSDEGKRLLNNLLENGKTSILPPVEATHWIETDWKAVCGGGNSISEQIAALTVVKRGGWDGILKPVYDMMRHRNGDYWYNTEDNSHKRSKTLKVRTKRDVKAGEELYASVNMCMQCLERKLDNYGTPEIFRDYGFVEEYPQRWYFPSQNLGFEITQFDGVTRSDEDVTKPGRIPNHLFVNWVSKLTTDDDAGFIYQTQLSMMDTARIFLQNPPDISPRELSAIRKYLKSMMEALTLILQRVEDEPPCPVGKKKCVDSLGRYENLMTNSPPLLFPYVVCDNKKFYAYRDYEQTMEETSAYQKLEIMYNKKTEDVCIILDTTTQQCTSYRPHYHEPMVHYTARFHENIKRVVFVGGGDSMLLHEILKYPSLELVVGLELDQSVTRTAFKYFGSQPHWDNEKVEWWYGDACKSLLMLPKEYFGSFDMVLVDLSETVMALSVTKKLDIFQALSLLLKPDGTFVKNEDKYFEKMVDIFVHTIQVHYYDVPVICSQTLSIGSNKNNYLQNKLTDHNIDSKNVIMYPLNVNQQYAVVHDYEYNPSNLQQHCKEEGNVAEIDELKVQTNSPGIVIIMDVEDASLATQPLQEIEEVLKEVLEKQGLTVLSVVTPSAEEADKVIIIFLKEGFVVSRMWSEHKYVAFDIHFWGSFERQKRVKSALFACAGSVSGASSSYRIVAGGMFGLSTWREDEKRRGPHKTIHCDTCDIKSNTQSDQGNVAAVILKESMKFVPDEEGIIVVVCGHEASQPCKSAETLQNVDNTLVLWSCSSIDTSATVYDLEVCKAEVLLSLRKFVKVPNIRTIVLDSTVPHEMGQILFKIFTKKKKKESLLSQNISIFAISSDEKKIWQENFIDRIRKDIIEFEPVFKAKCLFKDHDTTTSLYIVARDELFIPKLNNVRFSVEEKTGLVSTIEDIYGGQFHHYPGMKRYNGNYEFSHISVSSDYDLEPSFEQWSSQKPLEQQTIFQLELQTPDIKLSTNMIKDAYSQTLGTINTPGSSSSISVIEEFAEAGDGCVLVSFWSGSRVILTWDGRAHLDINVSTLAQNVELANKFSERFLELIPTLRVVLKDKQPRGYGRVVNFLDDISNFTPYWA